MEKITKEKAKSVDNAKLRQIKQELHPLELKYGREPKIEPTEKWHWH